MQEKEDDAALEELYSEAGDVRSIDTKEEEIEKGDSEDEIPLFLWEQNNTVYEMFRLLSSYFGEGYSVDSAILLKLIEKKELDLEQTLYDIAYIRSGYIEVVTARSTPRE